MFYLQQPRHTSTLPNSAVPPACRDGRQWTSKQTHSGPVHEVAQVLEAAVAIRTPVDAAAPRLC